MNDNSLVFAPAEEYVLDNREQISLTEQMIRFYEEAGIDYEHWSRNFNMHFGFYRAGFNPFKREKMLEQMNLEVAARLQINSKEKAFLIDLGCGVGATARTVARNFSNAVIKGVTIVPWQVRKALELNERENLQNRIEIFEGNYSSLPFAAGAADGVWAVESACYADGATKENLVREMARILRTGGRFVFADCFVKRPEKPFNRLMEKCYRGVCDNWVLPEMATLEHFVPTLEKYGFRDIIIEDISWRIAPSVAHAPFAVLSFIFKKLLAGETLKRQSVNNLKASLLSLILGTNRSKFSYCLISGTRS